MSTFYSSVSKGICMKHTEIYVVDLNILYISCVLESFYIGSV